MSWGLTAGSAAECPACFTWISCRWAVTRLLPARRGAAAWVCRYSGGDWHADEYETPDEYARRLYEEMQVGPRSVQACGCRDMWAGMSGECRHALATARGWACQLCQHVARVPCSSIPPGAGIPSRRRRTGGQRSRRSAQRSHIAGALHTGLLPLAGFDCSPPFPCCPACPTQPLAPCSLLQAARGAAAGGVPAACRGAEPAHPGGAEAAGCGVACGGGGGGCQREPGRTLQPCRPLLLPLRLFSTSIACLPYLLTCAACRRGRPARREPAPRLDGSSLFPSTQASRSLWSAAAEAAADSASMFDCPRQGSTASHLTTHLHKPG